MENCHAALLDAVDEHAFDIRHILDEARHDVAGGAIVEPVEREFLDVRVKLAAQIEDHALLEVVVENNAQAVEAVLGEEGGEADRDERNQLLGPVLADDFIHDPLGHGGKDDHHQRACDRAEERGESQKWIAPHIGQNSNENLHQG